MSIKPPALDCAAMGGRPAADACQNAVRRTAAIPPVIVPALALMVFLWSSSTPSPVVRFWSVVVPVQVTVVPMSGLTEEVTDRRPPRRDRVPQTSRLSPRSSVRVAPSTISDSPTSFQSSTQARIRIGLSPASIYPVRYSASQSGGADAHGGSTQTNL